MYSQSDLRDDLNPGTQSEDTVATMWHALHLMFMGPFSADLISFVAMICSVDYDQR